MLTFLSCASSRMTTRYFLSSRSCAISLNRIPSVMNLIFVSDPTVDESKRIWYPTNCPRLASASVGQVEVPSVISYSTLAAVLVTATRRGWVMPMMPSSLNPASYKN